MRRWSHVPYNPSAVPPPGTKPQPPQRVPQAFIEAMKRLTSEKSATQQANQTEARPSDMKWKSSFKPVGDEEENSEDKGTSSSERLYDPYSPLSSDTEADPSKTVDRDRSPPRRGTSLERQRLSPSRGSRWDIPFTEPESRALDKRELSAGSRPAEGRGPEPDDEDLPGYGSMSRALDQRGCSPDRTSRSSSTHRMSPYSQQVIEEERMAPPEYRREISTTVRLSPPRLNWNYERQPFLHTGLNRDPVSPRVRKSWSKNVVMNKDFISCDLCDIVVASGQELDDHFDSKSHWDTLEHIQQNNNYDDVAIAFLQDVMLYKSRQCSRAMEDVALPALQENEYMTKVEMFHCAACKVFVYSSAAEVESHITSHEHLSNTKEFEAQQRRACLSKAKTMMQELQPQLELFLKGGSPFE
ncbi:DBIRD complex subunit ZNF326 [Salarias fasciatus]|uniref:U1-type domain-containing protein n=1 Tax=Salarias fasciatus TaxID=181472 RepID=A0A672J5E8_SALFA|nr:DBIRD complex subunit ZNF326 [Salarias fasciatus]